ncbi:MAG: SGNH/GDSL hydrolase family protein [Clostridia bacterium]|nr:SGNH/GDSL hydrolase family protein [Clostridia bacterium]
MKIVFFGDSITDMCRNRDVPASNVFSLGFGYPFVVASKLSEKDPNAYEICNRGISGNRVVDLYARIKADVWNLNPDVLAILIGINDIWHELDLHNGVELDRYEKVYRMLIEDTLKVLPDLKIMLLEPFVLHGGATDERFAEFEKVYDYAKVVKKLAKEYNLVFVPLQERFDEAAKKFGAEPYLSDGVHPNVAGATLIADEWCKAFFDKIEK